MITNHNADIGVSNFYNLCARKNLGTHHNNRYHITLARKYDEESILRLTRAFGFPPSERDGKELDTAPPYLAKNHDANEFVPQFFLVLGITPARSMTVELVTSGKNKGRTSIRTTYGILKPYIKEIVEFFGKIADCSAKKGDSMSHKPEATGKKKKKKRGA